MQSKRSPRSNRETGSVLVLALFVMMLLSLLGVTLLTVAATEHSAASNSLWSEGALTAAEGAANRGLNQLSANTTTSTAAIPTTTLGAYTSRSGDRNATTAQPLTFVAKHSEEGYSKAVGSVYSSKGAHGFLTYQINATGTGPRNARREVEMQAVYGPID